MAEPAVLILTPEPPYPLHGGGAFRIASLIHYFARQAAVDLILFSESGRPAVLPEGLVRSQKVIALPVHDKAPLSRYLRNARRAIRGVPPLIDRLAGFGDELDALLAGSHYDAGIVEHFWAAPYLPQIARVCEKTVLDLHNIESVLHARSAATSSGLMAAGHARFATRSRSYEASLLPRYDLVLATSESDAATAQRIAPNARIAIYPNALPAAKIPAAQISATDEEPVVVFSGNFEYHPNIDAVGWLASEVWPEIHRRCPELRLRLVGRGEKFIRHLLPSGLEIETTGQIGDARAAIARARFVIAPLRSGSGTRIKILEGWAAARPVVATALAAEGLACRDHEHIAIANTSENFGTTIAGLNADSSRRAELAV
ncbi:MAG TPA: glycosyltransferase, partial [Bryobacteraceae bacterium]|nr:glycosyltransferase [Bryobacteraceae bacterium]